MSTNLSLYCTLDSLQSACIEAVFALPRPDGTSQAGVCRAADPQERRAVEIVVSKGVRWFSVHKPPRTRKARERMKSEVAERARTAVATVGLLVLIGETLFWWVVRQALDWLWDWFKGTDEAPALICGMVAGLEKA